MEFGKLKPPAGDKSIDSCTIKPCSGVLSNEFMYSNEIYKSIDLPSISSMLKKKPDVLRPGTNLVVRPLNLQDFEKGYLDLLTQLTDVGNVPVQQFVCAFTLMKNRASHFITVIEDESTGMVIATATLFLEQKFIHNCGRRGRIEDVVVNENHRSKQLGKLLVLLSIEMSKVLRCYKLTLDCKDENTLFYQSLGFVKEEGNSNYMQMRFCPKN